MITTTAFAAGTGARLSDLEIGGAVPGQAASILTGTARADRLLVTGGGRDRGPRPPLFESVLPHGVCRRAAAAAGSVGARLVGVSTLRSDVCTLDARARLGVRGGKPVRFRALPNARVTLRLRPVRRTARADVDDIRLSLSGARRVARTAL